MTRGIKKCNDRKRFNVGWDTEKFPHNHSVVCFPTQGIAEIMLVITVAPQNDICPQGNTYPIKAAPMDARRITTPEAHTIGIFEGELKQIPRLIWMYISMKNSDAPFICKYRIAHPESMSRMMWITESNAIEV